MITIVRLSLIWVVSVWASQTQAQFDPALAQVSGNDVPPVKVQDVVNDSAIQQRLRAILSARPRYRDLKLSVDSGIVNLSGTAKTSLDSEWAEELALRTEGVVFVDNQLSVTSDVDLEGDFQLVHQSLERLWVDFIKRMPLILGGLLVLVATGLMAKSLGWLLDRMLANRMRLRRSLRDLIIQLSTIATWVIGLLLAAVIIFPGMTPARALTFLGVGSVAIGFAFKDIFENFFAGILILWRYPFDRGDFIQCGPISGCVEEITIRNTMIRRLDGELAVIPNAHLFKNAVDVLTNLRSRRVRLVCGIAYGESVDAARSVIADAVRKCVTVDGEKMIDVFAREFADSSINFEVAWWTGSRPAEVRRSRDEVVGAIKSALDEAGIEIPFPYRSLTFPNAVPIEITNHESLVAAPQ